MKVNSHKYVSISVICIRYNFFFFQAEDGIRDLTVTGVQTCALPICACSGSHSRRRLHPEVSASPIAAAWARSRQPARVQTRNRSLASSVLLGQGGTVEHSAGRSGSVRGDAWTQQV